MPPKNIAIITGQLVVGGAERQLYLWLLHMDRERFRPVVLTLHPDNDDYWEDPVESLGVPLLRAPRRKNKFERLVEVTNMLRPYHPCLVHGWHIFASPYAGAVSRLLGAQASLGSLRSSFDSYIKARSLSWLTEHLVDGIMVNSKTAGIQLVQSNHWTEEKVHIVPNAVELLPDDRSRARRRLRETCGIPESRVWIGSMGRFDPGKRFDLLLKVMADLRASDENVHLVLIGYGPMEASLKSQVEAYRISDCVTFVGKEPEARKWLSALDIFCFPSPDEGLPNVVMEAAAAGLPVVSWRTPFLEELMDEVNSSLLAESGNLNEFIGAIKSLIHDPQLRNDLGQAGRRQISNKFSIDLYIAGMTKVYEKLLAVNPETLARKL